MAIRPPISLYRLFRLCGLREFWGNLQSGGREIAQESISCPAQMNIVVVTDESDILCSLFGIMFRYGRVSPLGRDTLASDLENVFIPRVGESS